MEEWRNKLIVEAETTFRDIVAGIDRTASRNRSTAARALEMKRKIIAALREPATVRGHTSIYVSTHNHLLAHDVAKALHVQLIKKGERDGVNYRGKKDGIPIDVYGPEESPGCKIIKKKVYVPGHTTMKYELQCKGGKDDEVQSTDLEAQEAPKAI